MKNLLYRPVIALSLLLGLLVLIELTALSVLTMRNLDRIDTVEKKLAYSNRLRQLGGSLEEFLLHAPGDAPGRAAQFRDIHRAVREADQFRQFVSGDSAALLERLRLIIANGEKGDSLELSTALEVIGELQERQTEEEEGLLESVYADTELEFKFAIGVPVMVIGLVLLSGQFLLRRHILNPLDRLKELVSKLADGEFSPIEIDNLDPMLLPLFLNYNRMVGRLAELEAEHRSHTHSLEREVREATRTLLEQSRSLSRAERLAAVGELAAGTAHELRNPLAGIKVALENMRQECSDLDQAERFELIVGELRRLTERLNDLLASSQHVPDLPSDIDLGGLIDDLFALLRYQVDEDIELNADIQPGLQVFLPATELRQVLLNLILNATQSLENGQGKVTVSARRRDHELVLKVCDNGRGFPQALLEGGIRPFATYREEGTGLGLLMVRRFAHNLGGKLQLQNDAPDTCATLILPAYQSHA